MEISCTQFQTVADAGGSCPADTANIVLLFKELSAALTPLGKTLSVASQAAKPLEIEMAIAALYPYISHFHVMNYDYAVSDIPGAGPFSPNAPLYTPADPRAVQMSINYTVMNYLAAGVPPGKITVGIPLYGHSWYNPTLNGTDWQGWGGATYVQGSCCGPFATTNGGKPGKGAQQCGTLMYSEIAAATAGGAGLTFYDNETQSSALGYAPLPAKHAPPTHTHAHTQHPRPPQTLPTLSKWALTAPPRPAPGSPTMTSAAPWPLQSTQSR